MLTRRSLLASGAALGGGLLLPGSVRAAVPAADRKFLFVWVAGGWDPTKVFFPSTASTIDRERTDERATYGDLSLVANPARPATSQFFADYHRRVSTLDGILIRSVNHPICRNLFITGSPNADRPDWPSTIGHASADRYAVPHVLIQGFSMAGAYSAYTSIAGRGGQLEQLLSGSASLGSDVPYIPPTRAMEALMDQAVAARAVERSKRSGPPEALALTEAYRQSAERLIRFKEQTNGLDLDVGSTLVDQIPLAMTLLSEGVARCVTLQTSGDWDTHFDNNEQGPLYETLFSSLSRLMRALDTTPGMVAPTLAEETTVIVFSEMGRTPYLNSTGGKDHWMYSSALIFGSGIVGGRQFGGYDDNLNGLPVDLATGDTYAGGVPITPEVVGSTLLTLAGLDPAEELGQDQSLGGLI